MSYIAKTKPIKLTAKSHEDWLLNRRGGIGSSEVASIVGLNPYESAYQLWLRKTKRVAPKEENFFMKAGHYLEDAVARFYEDESGRKVISCSAAEDVYVHPNYDWARVSPDRMFWLGDKRAGDDKGILECKTTQREIDPENLPPYWFTQVQYQLGNMGREKGSLAWLSAGRVFDYRDIDFVPDYYEWIMAAADEFYNKNIVEDIEPELTTAADVVTKYAVHTPGLTVEATDELAARVIRLKEIKASEKDLDAEKDEIEDALKLAIGEAEAINYQGSILATFKAPKAGKSFDKKAFQTAEPDLYAKYCVESQGTRRLLVK